MVNDCQFVRELLLALTDKFAHRGEQGQKQNRLFDEVHEMLLMSGQHALEGDGIKYYFKVYGNRPVHMPDRGEFIILRAPDNQVPMVPVLGLSAEMQGSMLNGLMVSLALYLRDDNTGDLRALGYRFEERSDGPGIHYFYHAQNVRQFNPATYLPLPTPSWIPDSQPSFPLQAKKPVALLVCALVAIYGGRVLDLGVKDIKDHFQEGPAAA